MNIDELLGQTKPNETELFMSSPFDSDKKREWLKIFSEIGVSDKGLIELANNLKTSTSYVPDKYLALANEYISETFANSLPALRWLFYEYTDFPYSAEASARLIVESLERGLNKFPSQAIPIGYTTRTLATVMSAHKEVMALSSFNKEDYGHIDIVEGCKLLINKKIATIVFCDFYSASDHQIDLRLVFSYDPDAGRKFLSTYDSQIDQIAQFNIRYDKKGRILYIGENRIVIKGNMQANLCSTLIRSKYINKVWSNDEVFEAWQWPDNRIYDDTLALRKENRLKIYQTASDVNKKVNIATKGEIDALFSFDTKSIAIDEKYRKFIVS